MAFDELFLDKCIIGVAETIPTSKHDDNITLHYKSNSTTSVSVNIPFGMTETDTFENIVQPNETSRRKGRVEIA